MNKYYAKIGIEHHRFCGVNIYAARQIAKSIAEANSIEIWDDPVIYEDNIHGEFWRITE